jgi:hypothetical protein
MSLRCHHDHLSKGCSDGALTLCFIMTSAETSVLHLVKQLG